MMKHFFKELKRRQVYRVAITYVVVAWLVLQVVSVIVPIIDAPSWVAKVVLILLIVGFPIAIVLAWAFEMTPDGMVRTSSVSTEEDAQMASSRRYHLSNILIGILLLVIVGQFAYNRISSNDIKSSSGSNEETERLQGDIPAEKLVHLAALPFSNVSGDANVEYLGFALVDQVISSLAYLKNMAIRPSSSIRRYSSRVTDPQEVAEALSVQFLLMGHYLTRADSVRLNLELIDVQSDQVIWTGSVQEQMEDIFKLQDVVARKVIDGLEIQFSQEERKRMVIDAPRNALAYEYFLKGLSKPYSVEGNQLAIGMLEKSLELDSSYAPIFAELGNRIHFAANYSVMDTRYDQIEKALGYLNRSLEINGEYLTALGYLSLLHTEINELEEALAVSKKILEINPNHALGHFALGYVYRYTGMIDEAVFQMEQAVSIDPKNNQFRSIGVTYCLAGKFDKALRALVYEDGSGFSESWRGLTYIRMNQFDKARKELLDAIEIDPEGTLGIWCQVMLSYCNGETWSDERRDEIWKIEQTIEDPEAIYYWSLVNVMHGDYDRFLVLFEKAVNHGFYPYPAFIKDPMLNPLQNNPEFKIITEMARKKHETFKAKYF